MKNYRDSQGEGECGDIVEGLEDEEVGEPQSGRFLCEWPGCPYQTDNEADLVTHLRQIHDRIMWVCPVRTCHRCFATEEETWDHIEVEHCGSSVDSPTISLEYYRVFNTTELRKQRRIEVAKWIAGAMVRRMRNVT